MKLDEQVEIIDELRTIWRRHVEAGDFEIGVVPCAMKIAIRLWIDDGGVRILPHALERHLSYVADLGERIATVVWTNIHSRRGHGCAKFGGEAFTIVFRLHTIPASH